MKTTAQKKKLSATPTPVGKRRRDLLPKKYKIQECVDNLKKSEYKIVLKSIPEIIGKGMTTFYNYRDILIDDLEDIPFKTARKLEILFGLEVGELENEKTTGKHYSQVVKEHINQLQNATFANQKSR